jgi:hypothetical protein
MNKINNSIQFQFWLRQIAEEIPDFIENLSIRENLNFCPKGSLKGSKLFSHVFASKILYMLGKLNESYRKILVKNILEFRKPNTMIYQNLSLTSDYIPFYFKNFFSLGHNLKIIRLAETRQAFASLLNCGHDINYNFFFASNISEIKNFLNQLNINDPWGFFSHISHLIFFINYSKNIDSNEKKKLIYEIYFYSKSFFCDFDLDELKKKFDNRVLINSFMKLTMALDVVYFDLKLNKKKIIDLALQDFRYRHACDLLNTIKVINFFHNAKYRHEEVKSKLLNYANIFNEHYNKKFKGFSFFYNKSQNIIYNKKVSCGYNEPDLHGTVLYLWGLALIENTICDSEFVLKKLTT